MGWKKQTTGIILILTYLLFLLNVTVVVCLQHLTTFQLLPPGSQFDSCLLTGCSVCFITGTTQRCTACLSAQVKHTVTEGQTHIQTEHVQAADSQNHIISHRDNLEKGGRCIKTALHTHSGYSLLVGFGWEGGVAGSKRSLWVRKRSTLS